MLVGSYLAAPALFSLNEHLHIAHADHLNNGGIEKHMIQLVLYVILIGFQVSTCPGTMIEARIVKTEFNVETVKMERRLTHLRKEGSTVKHSRTLLEQSRLH